MIDHISVAVRDLVIAERFYTAVLTPLGLFKVRDLPDAAIGFGKKRCRLALLAWKPARRPTIGHVNSRSLATRCG